MSSDLRPLAERYAEQFHETYERLALGFSYGARAESAVPWTEIQEPLRSLMIETVEKVLGSLLTALGAAEQRAEQAKVAEGEALLILESAEYKLKAGGRAMCKPKEEARGLHGKVRGLCEEVRELNKNIQRLLEEIAGLRRDLNSI